MSASGYSNLPKRERALTVALEVTRGGDHDKTKQSLDELGELVKSAGADVVHSVTQRLESPTAPYYIGKGKAEELAKIAVEQDIQSIIFDDELTPAQARNLEELFKRKVLDRTQLILDIFSQRAKTREGKLQIELAQLKYLLPRLTGMWTHLSRQTGGIGTRGPGETQLEVDKRRIQERIFRLEKDLKEVRKHRVIQREGRDRHHWPICALVGYTNAGKSTFMNRLTAAHVFAADQLFATLDPTIRQFMLPNKQKALLADTVGFLQKLPHDLVESFRATLEEVHEADILFHVIDASHEDVEGQIKAVEEVLKQIGAHEKQTMHIFNKKDMVTNEYYLGNLVAGRSHAVAVSALTGEGMDAFYTEIERMLRSWRMQVRLRIPQSEGSLLAEVQRVGHVLELRYEGNEVCLTVHIPPLLENRLRPYILAHEPAHPRNGNHGAPAGTAGAPGSGSAQDL